MLNGTAKLLEVVLAFNSEHDYVNLLNTILNKMMELTNSDAGTLYIKDENKLYFRIIKNVSLGISQTAEEKINLPPVVLDEYNIENVSAYCAIHNQIIIIDDVYTDDRFNFQGPKNYDKITGYRTRSMLVIPLASTWGDEPDMLGVIQLMNTTNQETGEVTTYGKFNDQSAIIAISRIAAHTLANSMYTQDIDRLLQSFMAVMTQVIDERSSFTRFHTQNVANYCKAFLETLSLAFPKGHEYHFSKSHIKDIVFAAMLHDIGKISTPTHILDKSSRFLEQQLKEIEYRFQIKKYQLEVGHFNGTLSSSEYHDSVAELDSAFDLICDLNTGRPLSKDEIPIIQQLSKLTYTQPNGEIVPILNELDMESLSITAGTLTPEEWTQMRDHAAATGRLLDRITYRDSFSKLSKWARDHHEFLDGSGYPNKLQGHEVALESCIITIMDIFEALTAKDRPYRKGMPPERAVNILQEMADEGKLHKELVDIFIKSRLWEGLVSI